MTNVRPVMNLKFAGNFHRRQAQHVVFFEHRYKLAKLVIMLFCIAIALQRMTVWTKFTRYIKILCGFASQQSALFCLWKPVFTENNSIVTTCYYAVIFGRRSPPPPLRAHAGDPTPITPVKGTYSGEIESFDRDPGVATLDPGGNATSRDLAFPVTNTVRKYENNLSET